MLRGAWVLVLVALGAGTAGLVGCQGATQAKLSLYTDVPASADVQVGLWTQRGAGALGPQATFEPTWTEDGVLGSLVTVPETSGDESSLNLRVVLSRGRPATSCSTAGPGCIIATRRLSFVRHTRLTVPIGLFQACDGVRCDEGSTCNSLGKCVSDALDPASCTSAEGCILEGDPASAPGVRKPTPAPEVRTDAGSDATTDASAPIIPTPLAAYLDEDPRRGFTRGKLDLSMPAHDPPVDGYLLSFTDNKGTRQLLTTAPLASPLALQIPETKVPDGMEWLEVVAARGKERSAPRLIEVDNFLRAVDVGANAGVDSLSFANVLIDTAKSKLVIVATDAQRKPTARVCDLDGSSCTLWSVDAGLGPDSASAVAQFVGAYGVTTNSALDLASRQLFIATTSRVQGSVGTRLIQCGLDSRSCTERQVSPLAFRAPVFVDASATRVLLIDAGSPATGGLFGAPARPAAAYSCPYAPGPCARIDLPTSLLGGTQLADMVESAGTRTVTGAFYLPAPNSKYELAKLTCPLDNLGACTLQKAANIIFDTPPSGFADAKSVKVSSRVGITASYSLFDCDEALVCTKRPFDFPGGGRIEAVTFIPPASAGTYRFLSRGYPSGAPSLASVKVYECPVLGGACSSSTVPSMGSQPRFHGEHGGQLIFGITSTISDAYNADVPSYALHTCGPTVASCTRALIASDESRGNSAHQTDVTIDSGKDRSVVISTNPSDRMRSAVFVCNARGEGCVYRAPSGDEPAFSSNPRALFPGGGQRLVTSVISGGKVLLSSCAPDGSGCTTSTLAVAGATIDETALEYEPGTGRVAVLAFESGKVHHFRCNTEASACVHTPLGALPPKGYGNSYRTTVTANRLWVVSAEKVLSCALDGTDCALTTIDASTGIADAQTLFDTKRMKLVVIPSSGTNAWECDTSGTSCAEVPLVGARPSTSFTQWSQAVLDPERGAAYFAQSKSGSFDVHRCARDPSQWTCAALGSGGVPFVMVLTPPRDTFGLRIDAAGQRLVAAAVDARSRRPTLYTMRLF
jgi:hypothetical protein